MGTKYGRIDGDVAIKGDTLTLSNGLVDTGFGRLTTNGVWVNAPSGGSNLAERQTARQ
ncbi:membrane protein [Klebsiella pneumoniae]|uniref:Membrane protein n=1 Tax=Klebsiella pneumoniae TaxID=573 RepID=A0A3S4KEA9_KLEPN|nr:membrane protein [Klebsiella pneumoniae]